MGTFEPLESTSAYGRQPDISRHVNGHEPWQLAGDKRSQRRCANPIEQRGALAPRVSRWRVCSHPFDVKVS
jgi:hypothetical protein